MPTLIERLNAAWRLIGADPDGMNINEGVGVMHMRHIGVLLGSINILFQNNKPSPIIKLRISARVLRARRCRRTWKGARSPGFFGRFRAKGAMSMRTLTSFVAGPRGIRWTQQRADAALGLVAMAWGSSYLLMKMGLEGIPPL